MPPPHPPLRLAGDSPLFGVLVAYASGILVGEWAFPHMVGCQLWLTSFCTGALLAALVLASRGGRKLRFAAAACAFSAVTGYGALALTADRCNEGDVWPDQAQTYLVLVDDAPRPSARSLRVTGQVMGGVADGRKVSWRLACQPGQPLPVPGDLLLCHATVTPPRNAGNPGEFDYAAWLRRQGISGTAFCPTGNWRPATAVAVSPPLTVRALRLRTALVSRYTAHFDSTALGVISALTLGDKTRLDTATRDRFSAGGVSHVLALSGLHLSILFAIYQWLVLRHCRQRMASVAMSVIGLAGLWGFAFLAGLPLSLLRAAIMFTVMQVLGLLRRDGLSVNNLVIAALAIVLIWPQALFDIGWQLSCLSVLAILLFANRLPAPRFVSRYRLLRCAYGIAGISFIAQVATAPLVAYHFHSFPVYGLLANLIIVPLAYPLLGLAIVFFLVPFARTAAAGVIDALLQVVDLVLRGVTSLPGAVIEVYPSALTTALLYAALLLAVGTVAASRWRQRRWLLAAATLAVLAAAGVEMWRHRAAACPPQLVFCNLPSATAVHLIADARHAYLWLPHVGAAADSLATTPALRRLWASRAMAAPVTVAADTALPGLHVRGGIAAFNVWRIAVPADTLPAQAPERPFPVDCLFLTRGYRPWPERTLRHFRPRLLVLSTGLSIAQRERYTVAAARRGIAVHDMSRAGALVLTDNAIQPR